MCVHRSLWIRFTSALPNPWPFRSHRFALSASVPLRGPFFPPLCPCHGASSPVLIYDSCVVTQTFPLLLFPFNKFPYGRFFFRREKKVSFQQFNLFEIKFTFVNAFLLNNFLLLPCQTAISTHSEFFFLSVPVCGKPCKTFATEMTLPDVVVSLSLTRASQEHLCLVVDLYV